MSGKLRINVHINPSEVLEAEQNITLNVHDDTSWSDVCKLIKEKINNFFSTSLAFQYLDEDADYISGCTEDEWKDAISSGSTKSRDELVLHIKALPTANAAKHSAEPDETIPDCCFSDQWCCYERPMPANPIFDDKVPEKIVNAQSADYKYADEALRAVTLPLGPIGGGSIAVAGDGGLRQWQVVNEVNHCAHVPDSFFAVKVEDDGPAKSVVLQSNTWYDEKGFTPAPRVQDHVVPQASKDLLAMLPGVKTLEVTARYPIAEVDVKSSEVPVQVHLEAFNPCIPLNSKDSAIPMIIFNYTVTNPSDKAVKVTMLSSLLNFVGWDGLSDIAVENMPSTPGGNHNTLYTYRGDINEANVPEYKGMSGYYGLYMNNTKMDDSCSKNGEIAIGVLNKSGDENACLLQFTDVMRMWKEFTSPAGLSGQGKMGVSDKLKTWIGAISCCREIQAKASETFTFVLSWHFPNRYCKWGQWGPVANSKSFYYLGNYYNTMWKNVKEVVSYTGENIGRLTTLTRQFRDAMFASSIPWQLIDSAAGRVSVLRSPTFMWLEDSNLYCFEGCSEKAGCCPMNCTHVLNYEMVVAKCFPDLERKMRTIDLLVNMAPNAIIPSRTTMPLLVKREWENWDWINPNNTVDLASTRICLDGDLGTVLKAYREIRHGAPQDFVHQIWPKVKAMMARYMDKLDANKQGIITGAQPCTYDRATYGIDTFIGCLYLCALRAAEEIAILMNESVLATQYHQRFLIGSKNLDKFCFTNGKWYTQVTPAAHPDQSLGCGTFVDALIGQWWAHSLGLGYLLPKENIKSHLMNVFKRNHVTAFDPKTQKPRVFFDGRDAGLHITYWDVAAGEKIPKVPLRYSMEGAWSGLEHSFAGLLLYEGLNDTAYQVVEECRAKYDGTRRSPWNEIECGDHYARPMAAFLYFEIASGMTWDILAIGEKALNLNFAPICNATNFKTFFIVGSGWGSFSQTTSNDAGTVELSVMYGDVEVVKLGLKMNFTTAKATLNDKEIKTTLSKEEDKIILSFPEGDERTFASFVENVLTISAGETLKIALS